MPSAKGKPTDPKLKEKITEEVKQQPNKDGSGKGQMAAWKAAKIGKEYEARGGSYENEPGSKDKPEKGPPQKKSEAAKKAEIKAAKKDAGKEEKPKADEGKKKDEGGEKKRGRPKKGDEKKPKEQKEGERKSERMRGNSPLFGTKRKSIGTTGEESAAKKGKVKK